MPKGGQSLVKESLNVAEKGLNVAEKGVGMVFKETRDTVNKFKKTIVENKGIAVGFIVGMTVLAFIKSLVENLVMPLLAPVLGDSGERDWESKEIALGPVNIKVGKLLSSLLSLFITIMTTYIFVHIIE